MPSEPPTTAPSSEEGYFKTLFDAAPLPILIVDDDVRILDYNPSAAGFVGPNRRHQFMKPCGEAFHCVRADEVPEGCGHSDHCRDCVVRITVGEAFRDGKTFRRKTRMSLRNGRGDKAVEVFLSVTVAPFRYGGKPLVLLILEDITELVGLREIVPICAHCKKIRTDLGYWQSVEEYLRKHADLEFSHGICDDCMKERYGDVMGRRKDS